MSREPDEDEYDDDPVPELRAGHAGDLEAPEHEHPAGWLYLPDLSAREGWVTHEVPREQAPARRQAGFRPR